MGTWLQSGVLGRGALLAAALVWTGTGAWAAGPAPAGEGAGAHAPEAPEHPSWFKLSFLDLRQDVREAAAAGRRVMLYFYQDGCPYCKKLMEDNFGQRAIAEKTRRHFDVVAVNIWGAHEVTGLDGRRMTEKAFAAAQRVQFTPTLMFLDEKGREVVRINGYFPPHRFELVLDYVAARGERTGTLRDYLAAREPAPASGNLHHEPGFLQPPYRLAAAARGGERPLLVFFEQRHCRACDELHEDVLKRPQTRRLLRRFDLVLIDLWSAQPVQLPDGRTLSAAAWGRSLGVVYTPTLVFFDAQGREVFRTEAYLKAFHLQSALDYVASGAYRTEPSFQRYLQARADALRARGVPVELMK